jgi:4-diphosphocytidyl-2-C-methyl-D-erythritol kinase
MRLVLRAHAKINLNLRVTGIRPDGYHLLQTVFQTLELHDELTLEAAAGPLALACAEPGIPLDERNLVWKAGESVWKAGGRPGRPAGALVSITKRIPAQGGLGGGSSDGAAALVAFDAFWGTALEAERLAALARELGADVPFFLSGGTALGVGRGDEISPLADLAPSAVVLVFPPFGVSTPEAFRWFDQAPGQAVSAGECLLADGVRLPVSNDLQPAVERRHPEIGEVCRLLRDEGAGAASMTGSGSTVFGLFADDGGAARAAAAVTGAGWRAVATRTAGRGRAAAGCCLRAPA